MVELLSPAGSYEGFMAALSAGADAIYAGGSAFGARAYAQNFTNEELLKAIDIAHLYNKKLYLTVNTLCKDREFHDLDTFISPFYKAGLDGVIVQDIGIVSHFRKNYPLMEVHASTQMTLTSPYGAQYLKNLGATRIVPARELSLSEIQNIKAATDIEIECFIHGAMCYCYSGQCLFSSFLGGRSGNRGRCAQPCRLAYSVIKEHRTVNSPEEQYVLSMKDLSTLDILPDLIESQIASFKIEGRMKKPAYTGFVTSIYRKYIDLYYKKGKKNYKVDPKDKLALDNVYKRSEPEQGYYNKYNSRNLITLVKPNYESGLSDELFSPEKLPDIPLQCYGYFHKNEKCFLTLSSNEYSVTVYGDLCQEALKKPLSEEDVLKQLNKTGDTLFSFEDIYLDFEDDIFLPVKAINELRRKALEEIYNNILSPFRRDISPAAEAQVSTDNNTCNGYTVLCNTLKQLEAVCNSNKINHIRRIYVESSILIKYPDKLAKFLTSMEQIYIALPYICRQKDISVIKDKIIECELFNKIKGFLIRNYEELYMINSDKHFSDKEIISDFNLYSFNQKAVQHLLSNNVDHTTIPLELNIHEIKERGYLNNSELLYYGNIPLMISAGCISKTMNMCNPNESYDLKLSDRYGKEFSVLRDCLFDYNIILNSVPINLSSEYDSIKKLAPATLRIQFSTESSTECTTIIDRLLENQSLDIRDFTKGHFRKSVE